MFQITSNELNALATQTGFIKNSLEKVLRLINVLLTLKSNSVTMDAFVLKGGTALNFFVLDFPRLSVDVDLNYIRFISRSDMIRDRKRIASEIRKMFISEYRIEITKEAHALTQFSFFYQTMSGSSDMLKLEVNYLRRLPLLPPRMRNFKRFEQHADFLCLDDHELLAGKIIALLSRYTPRDLFDVYQMAISSPPLDEGLLRSVLLSYGITARASVIDLFQLKLDLISERDIRNILEPLLRSGLHPSREELVSRVENFLTPYLFLTDEEKGLIQNFYNSGHLDMSSLFLQEEIKEKLKISPSLQWKVQNIKKNLLRK